MFFLNKKIIQFFCKRESDKFNCSETDVDSESIEVGFTIKAFSVSCTDSSDDISLSL